MNFLDRVIWRFLWLLAFLYRLLPPAGQRRAYRYGRSLWVAWNRLLRRDIVRVPAPRLDGSLAFPVSEIPLGMVIRLRSGSLVGMEQYIALKPSDVAVDVGAHVGYYSVLMGKQVPLGRVIAIEPHPGFVACLEENVRANGLSNVVVIPKALSDKEGSAQFYQRGLASAILRHSNEAGKSPRTWVLTTTLDKVVDDLAIPEINLLKINVEGAEMEVLQGARSILTRSKRLRIVLEVHPRAVALSDVNSFLADIGFRTKVITAIKTPWVIADSQDWADPA